MSPKGPGSVQIQGNNGPTMSGWTGQTWTCPSSRKTSLQGRCLARWRPPGRLERVLPEDEHCCSRGMRSEQSGEAVCGSRVSVWQDISN